MQRLWAFDVTAAAMSHLSKVATVVQAHIPHQTAPPEPVWWGYQQPRGLRPLVFTPRGENNLF